MKFIPAITAGLLLSSNLYAADLLEIYREALGQDAQFAAARAAYLAAQEKAPQGLAGLLPSVNVSANVTANHFDTRFTGATVQQGGSRGFDSKGFTVTAVQPLYRKQNFAQYEQGKLQVTQAEAQFNAAAQDLIVRTAQAYFDILLAQDNVELAGAQKAAIAEQLAQAKRNFEVGTATITDTHEAQARFDLVTAQEIAAQNDLAIKRRALQTITGRMPDALNRVGASLALAAPQPADMGAWLALAEQASLTLAAQRAAYELAVEEVERNRGGHHPTLDVVATYASSSTTGSPTFAAGSDVTSRSIALQLALPLYQGGGQASRVREALALRDKAREDLEAAKRNVALATTQAYLGVTNGIAQVKALEQALVSTQSQLDSTKLGQEVGVRTAVDVLNAQQQLYSARRDLAQARYNYLLSQLRLKAAAGSLTEEDVRYVNQALQ